MGTKILMIHGRNQATESHVVGAELDAHIDRKKREFLAGLAKGLILAKQAVVDEEDVIFPFYGNIFRDAILRFEKEGGRPPRLEEAVDSADEAGGVLPPEVRQISELQVGMLAEMAKSINFDPVVESTYAGESGAELGAGDLLRPAFVRAALQFLSRKTGIPAALIRSQLTDVAYYLGQRELRDEVLGVVRAAIKQHAGDSDALIVVAHSLGSVVAFDLLADPKDEVVKRHNVKLFVTAGSPLGLKVVRAHLLGGSKGILDAVPPNLPSKRGWLNAYDVLDIVALIHPLGKHFTQAAEGQIVEERTFNPTDPHAIIDYLADPDVAAPIGQAYHAR